MAGKTRLLKIRLETPFRTLFNNQEENERESRDNLVDGALIDYRDNAATCHGLFRSLTDPRHIHFLAILNNIGDPVTHIPIKKIEKKRLRNSFSHEFQPAAGLFID